MCRRRMLRDILRARVVTALNVGLLGVVVALFVGGEARMTWRGVRCRELVELESESESQSEVGVEGEGGEADLDGDAEVVYWLDGVGVGVCAGLVCELLVVGVCAVLVCEVLVGCMCALGMGGTSGTSVTSGAPARACPFV